MYFGCILLCNFGCNLLNILDVVCFIFWMYFAMHFGCILDIFCYVILDVICYVFRFILLYILDEFCYVILCILDFFCVLRMYLGCVF